jgi:hypothetical protein
VIADAQYTLLVGRSSRHVRATTSVRVDWGDDGHAGLR